MLVFVSTARRVSPGLDLTRWWQRGGEGGGCGGKKVSETKDDLVEGEKAGELRQNVMKLLNYRISIV